MTFTFSFQTLVCCLLATTLAAETPRPGKPVENRGKRNLEYTIIHNNYPASSNQRTERRISTGPQPQRYSPFFPGPRPLTYRKGRPNSFPLPPYAVQMEPLIHYSQRDPLYDTNNLSLIADNNELSKPEDLQTDNNQISESVYGPPKHYVEQPVYIKEPEPIIEIIIKESNVTLPPLPTPPATPAPKKKEQVHVFYVKYKKNPNGYGKDSIIYEKPVPAISPVIPDEPEEEPAQSYNYGSSELVTAAPPPSTTLRTIIKPDSETYHSPSGIKVTFGKESFDYDKRSPKKTDDVKEESAPEPTISHPQARQFPISEVNLRQPSALPPGFHSGPRFSPETIRFPQPYRTLPPQLQSRPPQYKSISPQFAKQYLSSQTKYPPQPKLIPQFQAPPQAKPQFSQPLPSLQEYYFNTPRQPVPYQPFSQVRPQSQPLPSPPPSPQPQLQFEFPPHTHFPIQQQPPLLQQQNIFNQQLAQRLQKQKHEQQVQQQQQYEQQQRQQQQLQNQHNADALRHQQLQQQLRYQQQPQLEANQHFREPTPTPQYQFIQKPQNQQVQYNQQFQNQQQHFQQAQQVVPPGGELIPSLSKYEQHISIPVDPSQQPSILLQQQQQQRGEPTLSQDEFRKQIQQQFDQDSSRNREKGHYIVQNSPSVEQSQESQQKSRENYYIRTSQPTYQTSPRPTSPRTIYVSSTSTTTERPTTEKPQTTTESKKDEKALSVQLPDEVPDELRQQLLSSGILNNADISVLDYDKVGDIPLSALPPDQLANFYNAGGAQQISGSAPVPSYAEKDGTPVDIQSEDAGEDQEEEASENHEVKIRPPVEMKVVHYDPQTEQGKNIQEYYVKDTATQVEPVVLNDQTYNKYLPLKVNGAEFPIPDVPELKGKNITSVVVLAPVDYSVKRERRVRDTQVLAEEIQFVTGNLKDLLDNPTRENYKKFLDNENKTSSEKQSVILLVAG